MTTAAALGISALCLAVACGNERWSFDDVGSPSEVAVDSGSDGEPPCVEGETRCAAGCTDLLVAPHGCGACDLACESGLVCDLGTCHPACRSGRVECSGSCLDLDQDDRGCGGCGIRCVAPQKCRGGSCR